jgi:hypothetical protein
MTTTNLTLGIKSVSESEFNTTWYLAAPYKNSTYLVSTNALLNESTLTNQFLEQGSFTKRIWIKTNSAYENKAFEKQYVSSSMAYDAYGNVTQSTVNTNGEETAPTPIIIPIPIISAPFFG